METIRLSKQSVQVIHDDLYAIPEIRQYMSTAQYMGDVMDFSETDDWSGIVVGTSLMDGYMEIKISRSCENTFTIALYSKSPITAGRLIKSLDGYIKMYNPKAIIAYCHQTNVKSNKILNRLLGHPYGIEPQGAWNCVTGVWEDCMLFKKVLR